MSGTRNRSGERSLAAVLLCFPIMVAQVSNDTCQPLWISPGPEPSDSDDVMVALQTARALETQGDLGEAARWLRRAADSAVKDGNDERIVTFARAAADLTSRMQHSGAPATPPPSSRPATGRGVAPPLPARASAPPLPARASAPPLSTPISRPPAPSIKPVSSLPPQPPSTPSNVVTASSPDPLIGQPRALRVSFRRSDRDPDLIVMRRLKPGQPVPVGSCEAILVVTRAEDDPFAACDDRNKHSDHALLAR